MLSDPPDEDPTPSTATWTIDDYRERTGHVLLPQHHAMLVASAITLDLAVARGYLSATRRSELQALGFGQAQQRVPALVIPVHGVDGEVVLHQARPDDPRRNAQGKAIKYETPSRARMALDVPPAVRPLLGNPNVPLVVTEGARKADAAASFGLCCIAVIGVWNWRGSNDDGGKVALPDWEHIALNDRTALLAFDSDVTTKPPVQAALQRLREMLERRKAHVQVVHLPSGPNGEKVGLDDFLAGGHDRDDVLRLASPAMPRVERQDRDDHDGPHPYRAEAGGMVYEKPTRDGAVDVPLCNFTARIVAEVVEDDGVEQHRVIELSARLRRRTFAFQVTAAQFDAMNWITEQVGTKAVVHVGASMRDHLHNAIQLLSDDVQYRSVFTHTGWRLIDGQDVFLHGGGGLGSDGVVPDTKTRLDGGPGRFVLPDPPDGDELRQAVRTSLSLLEVAPDKVAVALLAMVYRAPLGQVDFSGWLTGPTGAGKSELAALAQQHYGATMDRLHLPGSWSSTANSLEGTAFHIKDALFVIDDFAPTGTMSDVQRLHRDAERLLRAQGNATGRGRMRHDTTQRPPKPPRGLILGTGEDIPRGQSLRARLLVVEVGPGDVNWSQLGELKKEAAQGTLAATMAGYLRWLAADREGEAERVKARFEALRELAVTANAHRRTPDIVANLAVGFERFLQFAAHVGAIDAEQYRTLWERGWRALLELGEAQEGHVQSAEPTRRFLSLLQAAIASGDAHVAAPSGEPPESPGSWGWRQRTFGTGEYETERWEPQGHRIGWLDGANLYLEPEASFAACQRLGQTAGEPLAITQPTLEKRLHERGLLQSTEKGRQRLRVRVRSLEGKRRPVLNLLATSLFSEPDQVSTVAADSDRTAVGPESGAGGAASDSEPAPVNGLQKADFELGEKGVGPVGPGGAGFGRIETPPEKTTRIKEWRA
jgi:Domain of unknown function (DUF3854)/Domain of unknown function (DUF927)